LHIGLGTFEPVKTEIVENYQMDVEWAEIDEKTAKFLNKAKKNGQRIIAVGTTTTRTLEGFSSKKGVLKSGQKFVDLFIYPGYQFKFIDALITNFHLPKSTLIMLVSALAEKI
jgi:S-adenosylmethionine:tRNA ribosyltransferase-isomerase